MNYICVYNTWPIHFYCNCLRVFVSIIHQVKIIVCDKCHHHRCCQLSSTCSLNLLRTLKIDFVYVYLSLNIRSEDKTLKKHAICLLGSVVVCLWWGAAVFKQGGAGKGAERGSQKTFKYWAKIWRIISLALLKSVCGWNS